MLKTSKLSQFRSVLIKKVCMGIGWVKLIEKLYKLAYKLDSVVHIQKRQRKNQILKHRKNRVDVLSPRDLFVTR